MLTEERAFELMSKSFESLKDVDMIGKEETLKKETVLLGGRSPLDSIGFVTFLTELEESMIKETKKDVALVLDQISEFNVNQPQLSAAALGKYLVKISQQ